MSGSFGSSLKKAFSRKSSKSSTDQGGYLSPSNDNPPPYTPAPSSPNFPSNSTSYPSYSTSYPSHSHGYPSSSKTTAPENTTSDVDDSQYAFLATFDTVFLIDDSTSMTVESRWEQTRKALQTITPICTKYDRNGIDIYFLNHSDSRGHQNVTTASTIIELFQKVKPMGATPTGQRLNDILKPYLRNLEAGKNPKPMNIIVITDGDASDDVESVILSAARRLDKFDAEPWQVGIQFFQVGTDKRAREMLKHLDDDIGYNSKDKALRDIVDTVAFEGERGASLTGRGILKVVLGSVNRRLDRNSTELHQN